MIRCNANLYRITSLCLSAKQARYCLNGVFVDPNPNGGVNLVATDSHRMLVIHDAAGTADESAIIALTPESIKACKAGRNETRHIEIKTGENIATIYAVVGTHESDDEMLAARSHIAISAACKIDGTFPDYRRVVPTPSPKGVATPFSGKYVADFGKAANELAKIGSSNKYRKGIIRILCSDINSPALILFDNSPHALGVLMPIRGEGSHNLPAWFTGKPRPRRVKVLA